MKYRSEIDGLRALAVVPVVLFHAGISLFSGGFVGVDIFFVISGYLITTILIDDIENKRFSVVKFYERRARRILPALFFVMLFCIVPSWIWMLPNHMKDFSQSLVAVSLFSSNILFWRESGYFAAAAEAKPLLHTWSLAVEEQYYLIFPIFLFFVWRLGKKSALTIIVAVALASLLLSEWGWRVDADANFYLSPTRAWELFAGSIAAFIVLKSEVQKNNALSLLGLMSILYSIFYLDSTFPFPSLYTLIPVLGTVLIVAYAGKGTLVAWILSRRLFVGVGLISYSLYLWHQPLLAFARVNQIHDEYINIWLVAISFIFSFLTWKYVERPFRGRLTISKEMVFTSSALGISIFLIFGLLGHISGGFKSRFSNEVMHLVSFEDEQSHLRDISCSPVE
ncbi:MAG: acyltransferase, partial [Gammaproteobacteria bacterium]